MQQSTKGQIHNYLGILDKSKNHFSPESLLNIYFNKSDLASLLGVQRTQLDQKTLPLKKGTKLNSRIMHLVMATDLVYEFMKNNQKKNDRMVNQSEPLPIWRFSI